ncbi:MAG: hypothetical protein HY702_05995 [Gemmatimonadetes bacterium]|nr:hypothetical protein [Gemmatimonadota bacterium]
MTMPRRGFWSRVREARLVRVLLLYLAASWLVLQVTAVLRNELQLPKWVTPVAVILLLVGLIVVSATAWIQSHPATKAREGEVPAAWEIDLKGLVTTVTKGRLPHLTWARAILGGVVAFSLLFGAGGIYLYLKGRGAVSIVKEASAAPGLGIAVLPFRVVGPDLELWREGMVDLLSTNLDGVPGLRAIDPRAVLNAWRSEIGEETEAPAREAALEVAQKVGASYALTGSIVGSRGEVRITTEIYDLATGKLQGTAQVGGSPDSILALVDRLSIDLLRTGLVREPGQFRSPSVGRITTSSVPALKAYLAGEQNYRRNRFREAIAHLTQAVEADSTFALALYRLANAYGWVEGIVSPAGREYARRAARFADRLPEREVLLLTGDDQLLRGELAAIETLEKLSTRYPDDVEGWYALGDAYRHLGPAALEPDDKFRSALRRAIDLDPTLGPAYIHLIEDAIGRHDSAEARELIRRYRQLDPSSPRVIGFDLAYALVWGDSASREQAIVALDTATNDALRDAEEVFSWADPDFWDHLIRVARARTDQRHPLAARQLAQFRTSLAYLGRGRLKEAREALFSIPSGGPWETWVPASLLRWHLNGDGFEDTSSARRAASTLASDPEPGDHFLIGALAAYEKRWSDVQKEIAALDSGAEESDRQRDTLGAQERRALAQALRGYAALQRDDRQTAVQDLEAARPAIPATVGVRNAIHSLLRYELGKSWLELGDPRKAERYFQSIDQFSPAQFYLGQIYEALGDPEQAKLHYARFVRWWEDCDPELRPWWERGRQALARLTRETATR